MSELTDLNATGNGLAAVSGGLQGLLEAYKMKMAQQVEQAKISQQGLDAGAQARMMAQIYGPIKQQEANAATLNAKTKAFEAGMSADGADAAGQSPKGIAVSRVLAGLDDPASLNLKDPATLLALNAQGKGVDMAKLRSDWAAKTYASRPATVAEQNNAKSVLDNLATLKSMVPALGLSDKPGAGSLMNYARLRAEAAIPGSVAANFLNKAQPLTMGVAKDVSGRFTMQEMPVTGDPTSFHNTGPSLTNNIDTYIQQLKTKAGIPDYQPRILTDTIDKTQNPGALAAPGSGATPSLAAPVAPVAAPGAVPAPGKYAHLTDAQLAAMAAGQ